MSENNDQSPSRRRISARLLLAHYALEHASGDDTPPAIELIGSGVADWVLAQCRSKRLAPVMRRQSSTSRQLQQLRDCGFIDPEAYTVLDTAYRARNIAHHEQVGLKREDVWVLWRRVSQIIELEGHAEGGPWTSVTIESVRAAVRRLEAEVRAKKKRYIPWIVLHLDPRAPFDEEFGPHQYTAGFRKRLTEALAERGMLAGVVRNHSWPLVMCDLCGAVVPVDNAWTPQINCMSDPDEKIDAFCGFGCSQWYQRILRRLEEEAQRSGTIRPPWEFVVDPQDYFIQNVVEIVGSRVHDE